MSDLRGLFRSILRTNSTGSAQGSPASMPTMAATPIPEESPGGTTILPTSGVEADETLTPAQLTALRTAQSPSDAALMTPIGKPAGFALTSSTTTETGGDGATGVGGAGGVGAGVVNITVVSSGSGGGSGGGGAEASENEDHEEPISVHFRTDQLLRVAGGEQGNSLIRSHSHNHAHAVGAAGHDDDSSDSTAEEDDGDTTVKEGIVSKWTNYVHGWQDRYLVLKNGVLSYYRDKDDALKHCRGTIDVSMATIKKHEFDNLRFDITMDDQCFYLRCPTEAVRQEWLTCLADVKEVGGPKLTRRPSTMSLTSVASTTSGASMRARTFPEKLAELKTFRDLLNTQTGNLQTQLSTLPSDNAAMQREVLAVRASTAVMLDTLSMCVEMMTSREEHWERKFERLQRKRRQLEEKCTELMATTTRQVQFNGPDFVEGPTSVLNEEEFFDAIETGLEQLYSETKREQLLTRLDNEAQSTKHSAHADHKYSAFLRQTITSSVELCDQDPQKDPDWQMVLEDGEMKVYRREVMDDKGIICDRLKAYHVVPGISAYEMCQYFFDTKFRMEWEHTVEKFFVLDRFGPDSLVFHNLHKRVWPSAQRDSCCLSHIRYMGDNRWVVQNVSVEHDAAPKDKYVRVEANILLSIRTVVNCPPGQQPKREHVTSFVTYLAYVNPGGWVPPAALRAVSKREYPKFLRTFCQQSMKHYSDKPLLLAAPETAQ